MTSHTPVTRAVAVQLCSAVSAFVLLASTHTLAQSSSGGSGGNAPISSAPTVIINNPPPPTGGGGGTVGGNSTQAKPPTPYTQPGTPVGGAFGGPLISTTTPQPGTFPGGVGIPTGGTTQPGTAPGQPVITPADTNGDGIIEEGEGVVEEGEGEGRGRRRRSGDGGTQTQQAPPPGKSSSDIARENREDSAGRAKGLLQEQSGSSLSVSHESKQDVGELIDGVAAAMDRIANEGDPEASEEIFGEADDIPLLDEDPSEEALAEEAKKAKAAADGEASSDEAVNQDDQQDEANKEKGLSQEEIDLRKKIPGRADLADQEDALDDRQDAADDKQTVLDEEADKLKSEKNAAEGKNKKILSDMDKAKKGWPGPPTEDPDPNCKASRCSDLKKDLGKNRSKLNQNQRDQMKHDQVQQKVNLEQRNIDRGKAEIEAKRDKGIGLSPTEKYDRLANKEFNRLQSGVNQAKANGQKVVDDLEERKAKYEEAGKKVPESLKSAIKNAKGRMKSAVDKAENVKDKFLGKHVDHKKGQLDKLQSKIDKLNAAEKKSAKSKKPLSAEQKAEKANLEEKKSKLESEIHHGTQMSKTAQKNFNSELSELTSERDKAKAKYDENQKDLNDINRELKEAKADKKMSAEDKAETIESLEAEQKKWKKYTAKSSADYESLEKKHSEAKKQQQSVDPERHAAGLKNTMTGLNNELKDLETGIPKARQAHADAKKAFEKIKADPKASTADKRAAEEKMNQASIDVSQKKGRKRAVEETVSDRQRDLENTEKYAENKSQVQNSGHLGLWNPTGISGDAKLSNQELVNKKSRLNEATERYDDAKDRIGKGGKQPGYSDSAQINHGQAQANLDKATAARDDALNRNNNYSKQHGVNQKKLDAAKAEATKNPTAENQKKVKQAEWNLNESAKGWTRANRDYRRANHAMDKAGHEAGIGKHEATAERASNFVGDYNSSYGKTIDKNGNVNTRALAKSIDAFQNGAETLIKRESKINTLTGQRDTLNGVVNQATAGGVPKDDPQVASAARKAQDLDMRIDHSDQQQIKSMNRLRKAGHDVNTTGAGEVVVSTKNPLVKRHLEKHAQGGKSEYRSEPKPASSFQPAPQYVMVNEDAVRPDVPSSQSDSKRPMPSSIEPAPKQQNSAKTAAPKSETPKADAPSVRKGIERVVGPPPEVVKRARDAGGSVLASPTGSGKLKKAWSDDPDVREAQRRQAERDRQQWAESGTEIDKARPQGNEKAKSESEPEKKAEKKETRTAKKDDKKPSKSAKKAPATSSGKKGTRARDDKPVLVSDVMYGGKKPPKAPPKAPPPSKKPQSEWTDADWVKDAQRRQAERDRAQWAESGTEVVADDDSAEEEDKPTPDGSIDADAAREEMRADLEGAKPIKKDPKSTREASKKSDAKVASADEPAAPAPDFTGDDFKYDLSTAAGRRKWQDAQDEKRRKERERRSAERDKSSLGNKDVAKAIEKYDEGIEKKKADGSIDTDAGTAKKAKKKLTSPEIRRQAEIALELARNRKLMEAIKRNNEKETDPKERKKNEERMDYLVDKRQELFDEHDVLMGIEPKLGEGKGRTSARDKPVLVSDVMYGDKQPPKAPPKAPPASTDKPRSEWTEEDYIRDAQRRQAKIDRAQWAESGTEVSDDDSSEDKDKPKSDDTIDTDAAKKEMMESLDDAKPVKKDPKATREASKESDKKVASAPEPVANPPVKPKSQWTDADFAKDAEIRRDIERRSRRWKSSTTEVNPDGTISTTTWVGEDWSEEDLEPKPDDTDGEKAIKEYKRRKLAEMEAREKEGDEKPSEKEKPKRTASKTKKKVEPKKAPSVKAKVVKKPPKGSKEIVVPANTGVKVAGLPAKEFIEINRLLAVVSKAKKGSVEWIDAQEELNKKVPELIERVAKEYKERSKKTGQDLTEELEVLSAVTYLLNIPLYDIKAEQSASGVRVLDVQRKFPSDIKPWINRITHLTQVLSDGSMSADPATWKNMMNTVNGMRELLKGLPKTTDPALQRQIIKNIANGYDFLAEGRMKAAQVGSLSPESKGFLEKQAVAMGNLAARYHLAGGDAKSALESVASQKPATADGKALQGRVLAEMYGTVEKLYAGIPQDQKQGIGGVEAIHTKKQAALQQWLDNTSNPKEVVAASSMLANELAASGKADKAVGVLESALRKAPNNAVILATKLRVQILNPPDDLTPKGVDWMVSQIPQNMRGQVLGGAIATLAGRGDPKIIRIIQKAIEDNKSLSEEEKTRLKAETVLAELDYRSSRTKDKKNLDGIKALEKEGKKLIAKLDDPEAKAGLEKRFAQRQAQSKKSVDRRKVMRKAISSKKTPVKALGGIAREALASGQLDTAGDALVKQLERSAADSQPEEFKRTLIDASSMLNLVHAALADPTITEDQRKAGEAFVKRVTEAATKSIDNEISKFTQTKSLKSAVTMQSTVISDRLVTARDLTRLKAKIAHGGKTGNVLLGSLARDYNELDTEVKLREARLRGMFKDFKGNDLDSTKDGRALKVELAKLNFLRAQRDGYKDVTLAIKDPYSTGARNIADGESERDKALRDAFYDLNGFNPGQSDDSIERNRFMTKNIDGVREKFRLNNTRVGRKGGLTGIEKVMLADEEAYLERRITQLINEDTTLDKDAWRKTWERKMAGEASKRKAWGNPTFKLFPSTYAYNKERAAGLYQQLKGFKDNYVVDDFNTAVKANDPQQVALALVRAREKNLSSEIDAYRGKMNVFGDDKTEITWGDQLGAFYDKVGQAHARKIRDEGKQVGQSLNMASAAQAKLHPALIRMSYYPIEMLSSDDKAILETSGFIKDGKYAVPTGVDLAPVKIGSKFAEKSAIDNITTIKGAAILGGSVLLPGAAAGHATRAIFAGRTLLGSSVLTMGSGLALEGALFMGMHKGTMAFIDPTTIENDHAWSLAGMGEEYVHTVATLGVLKGFGHGMGGARNFLKGKAGEALVGTTLKTRVAQGVFTAGAGSAALTGEAALLTMMGGVAPQNILSQGDDFAANMIMALMMRAKTSKSEWSVEGQKGYLAGRKAELELAKDRMTRKRDKAENGFKEEQAQRKINKLEAEIKTVERGEQKLATEKPVEAVNPAKILREAAKDRWTDSDYLTARKFMGKFGGDWVKAKKAFEGGKITEAELWTYGRLRKRVVDEQALEIVEDLNSALKSRLDKKVKEGEMTKEEADAAYEKHKMLAFGSDNVTSDYDLSFKGPYAELAVIIFNARWSAKWGRAITTGGGESAVRFDTNTYTDPIFREFMGGEGDIRFQDGFANLAGRKYMEDATWAEYREWVESKASDAMRGKVKEMMDKVETQHTEFEGRVEKFKSSMELAGKETSSEKVDIEVRNRLYEDSLRKIIKLKGEYAEAKTGKKKDQLIQELRNAQSEALYFAAEAYFTQGAIEHVVMSIQAAKRKVNAETLLSKGKPDTGDLVITSEMGRQSYTEQVANMYKDVSHSDGSPAYAGKGAKYFLRAFDAAKFAGESLTPHSDVVRETAEIESVRSEPDALLETLNKFYGKKDAAGNPVKEAKDLTKAEQAALVDTYFAKLQATERALTANIYGGDRLATPSEVAEMAGSKKTVDVGPGDGAPPPGAGGADMGKTTEVPAVDHGKTVGIGDATMGSGSAFDKTADFSAAPKDGKSEPGVVKETEVYREPEILMKEGQKPMDVGGLPGDYVTDKYLEGRGANTFAANASAQTYGETRAAAKQHGMRQKDIDALDKMPRDAAMRKMHTHVARSQGLEPVSVAESKRWRGLHIRIRNKEVSKEEAAAFREAIAADKAKGIDTFNRLGKKGYVSWGEGFDRIFTEEAVQELKDFAETGKATTTLSSTKKAQLVFESFERGEVRELAFRDIMKKSTYLNAAGNRVVDPVKFNQQVHEAVKKGELYEESVDSYADLALRKELGVGSVPPGKPGQIRIDMGGAMNRSLPGASPGRKANADVSGDTTILPGP